MPQIMYRVYLIWFIVGLFLVGFNLIPSWLEWANSVFLILAGIVAMQYAIATFGLCKGILLTALIGISTFTIEGVSAHYDIFFGSYDYTTLFPPLIAGVPIGIGFAWIVMIMAGHAMTIHIKSVLLRVVLAALYVVALDLLLDPVAYVVKHYWIWTSDSPYYGIPFSNFAGWFIIAIVWQSMLLFVPHEQVDVPKKRAIVVFWTIVLLFSWLALLNGLYLALIVGGVALLIIETIRRLYDGYR